jgi:23S rRNA pseudouridine1911/1915/1917 synthase
VNGQPKSAKSLLKFEDVVTTEVPAATDYSDQTLPILYEDDESIVINKPVGVLTHAKGVLNEEFTVADFARPRTTDGADTNRPGIVHRLDRATSGVLILAKSSEAKSHLQKQFQDRKAKKTYLAITHNTPKNREAIIRLPIERNPLKPQTFRIGSSGKSAETAYQVLDTFNDGAFSLIELKPVTGRTHQLRVHLQYLGCPIVGDTLYGNKKDTARLMLHAKDLEVTVPSRERKTFSADAPDDFKDFLAKLKKDN